LWRNSERPAQRLAHVHGQNLGVGNALGKAAAGDFDFWEFWHAKI
jgi:hypothetical protein